MDVFIDSKSAAESADFEDERRNYKLKLVRYSISGIMSQCVSRCLRSCDLSDNHRVADFESIKTSL